MIIDRYNFLTLVLLAGFWWLLTGGDLTSLVIGLPTVGLAAWAASRLEIGGHQALRLTGWLGFMAYFLWESLRGGTDVARRTLAPRMRINPGFAVYQTKLRRLDARVLFANCVSLLPGTLAADLHDQSLEIHLIDADADPTPQLRRLEQAIDAVYPETRANA